MPRPADPPPGLPPRYRVLRLLGRGGMGRVWLCRDATLEVEVAVKVLPPDLSSDADAVEQIRREARLAARLRGGPGILGLFAFEPFAEGWFLVEEFAAGGSLDDRLRTGGPLPEGECRRIGAEVAEALAFAHGQGVLHRDVKTANILLDARGGARLADFGLARALAEAAARRSDSSIVGTPIYMAPEVMWHGTVDARSDLYSLGCVLYEISTGRRPFDGPYHEIARAKGGAAATVPDPRAAAPGLSEGFSSAVRRLLALEPGERFPDGTAVSAALREGRAPPPPEPILIAGSDRFSQRMRPLRKPAWALAAAAALGASLLAYAVREPTGPGPIPLPEATPPEAPGLLDLSALPGDATVLVDGRPLPRNGGSAVVPAGRHGVSIERPGRETVRLPGIEVPPGGRVLLELPVAASPAARAVAPPPPARPADRPLPLGIAEREGRLFSDADGAEMAFVPGGEFLMGRDGGHPFDAPAHRVTVSALLVDRTEVTNARFRRFVAATGHRTDAERIGRGEVAIGIDKVEVQGADWRHPEGPGSAIEGMDHHPVVQVSWNDAAAFARWAGKRLPSEAEFERLLRRDREGLEYPWGDGPRPPAGFGNLPDASHRRGVEREPVLEEYDDGFPGTAPAASFAADPYGLFDVCGNVWEWCDDWFGEAYYAESPPRDPRGPAAGSARVLRGGSFVEHYESLRCVVRRAHPPTFRSARYGFRCVMELEQR